MAITLFKRKNKETQQTQRDSPAYNALINGLNEMERQGVDRIVLTLYESEPSKNAFGRFIDIEKEFRYYPLDMLDEAEQEMIKKGKTYTVVALVRDNVGGIVQYENKGIEKYHRARVHPLLPRLKPESDLNYATEGGIYTGKNFKKFIEEVIEGAWDPKEIEQRINSGIQEYYTITQRLMEKAGVYTKLEQMRQRKYSPFEQIMLDIRKKIK